MNVKRVIGIVLILAGLLGFLLGSVSVTTSEEVVDVGPVEVQKEQERTLPLGTVTSGAVLLVGVGLVGLSFRGSSGRDA
jgi:hypothetical protein